MRPSGRSIDWLTLLGILIGLGIAIYLTIVHYRGDLLVCGVAGDCHTVQSSEYAKVGPIPVAILGVMLMGTLLVLWLVRVAGPARAEWTVGIGLVLLVAAVAAEAYLTWVEIWVIEAICQWCVVFAIILSALLVLEAIRYWRLDSVTN
jgi:uncharacterized membrane protein